MLLRDEEAIVSKISDIVSAELGDSQMAIKENKGNENSIVVRTQPSLYLGWPSKEFLFSRINAKGKKPCVSFSSQYERLFRQNQVDVTRMKSQGEYVRIDIKDFLMLLDDAPRAHVIFSEIIKNMFDVPAFGCCDLYVTCSDNKKCVNPDFLNSLGCQYKANLENGRIFYGKNKNI